jgi:energy-coupling factor transporter transmembrane protein EcfT
LIILILPNKIITTNISARNAWGSLNIYIIAIIIIVPIKFKIAAIIAMLLTLTLSVDRLYNPMKIYNKPVPKNIMESEFMAINNKNVDKDCIVPNNIRV